MNFLAKLFAPKPVVIPVPAPDRFPGFDNIESWMEEKAAYLAATSPENLYFLFCPSMADYLPLNVTAASSQERFFNHIDAYNALKAKYPEAAKKGKENVRDWSIFNGGPRADYP